MLQSILDSPYTPMRIWIRGASEWAASRTTVLTPAALCASMPGLALAWGFVKRSYPNLLLDNTVASVQQRFDGAADSVLQSTGLPLGQTDSLRLSPWIEDLLFRAITTLGDVPDSTCDSVLYDRLCLGVADHPEWRAVLSEVGIDPDRVERDLKLTLDKSGYLDVDFEIDLTKREIKLSTVAQTKNDGSDETRPGEDSCRSTSTSIAALRAETNSEIRAWTAAALLWAKQQNRPNCTVEAFAATMENRTRCWYVIKADLLSRQRRIGPLIEAVAKAAANDCLPGDADVSRSSEWARRDLREFDEVCERYLKRKQEAGGTSIGAEEGVFWCELLRSSTFVRCLAAANVSSSELSATIERTAFVRPEDISNMTLAFLEGLKDFQSKAGKRWPEHR